MQIERLSGRHKDGAAKRGHPLASSGAPLKDIPHPSARGET